jgi:hypothetical protein
LTSLIAANAAIKLNAMSLAPALIREYLDNYPIRTDLVLLCFRYVGKTSRALVYFNITIMLMGVPVHVGCSLPPPNYGENIVYLNTDSVFVATVTIPNAHEYDEELRECIKQAVTPDRIVNSMRHPQLVYAYTTDEDGAELPLRDLMDTNPPKSRPKYSASTTEQAIDVAMMFMRRVRRIDFE